GGQLVKSGAGTLRLAGANAGLDSVQLNAGTILVLNNTALGTSTFVLNGGSIQSGGGTFTLPNQMTVSASSTVDGLGGLTFSNATTINSGATLTKNGTGVLTFANASNVI